MALVVMGILLGMLGPRLGSIRDRGAVRSGKQQVSAYLATARAAAIRRGRPATFHAASNSIWVTVGADTVGSRIALGDEYSITLSSASAIDSVRFDARGFATNLPGTQIFRVTRGVYRDSVCVSRAGMIARRCGF